MHMVWVDEHNRLARELEKLSNNKNDEVIQLLYVAYIFFTTNTI